jgi:hypothetical protein
LSSDHSRDLEPVSGSTGEPDSALVSEILDRMESRADEIAERMFAACRDEIPEYAPLSGETVADVVAHSAEHVAAFITAARRGSPPAEDELEFVHSRAADRARAGTPIEVLLRAYRMGQRETLRAILAASGEDPGAALAALSLSNATMTYTDAISSRATLAYLDVQRRMVSVTERARRDLLEDLLIHGEDVGDDQRRRAVAVGLEPGDSLVAVAVPPDPGCDDPETIARFEQAIARSTSVRQAPFVIVRRDEIVAVTRSPRDDGSGLARSLNRRLATRSAPHIRVGISTRTMMPGGLARAYAEARAALTHATDRRRVAALADVRLFDYLTAHADRLAQRVVPEACRRLLAADRGDLVNTLQAYTQADLNAARAAESLFVHPNTVHDRLRKIEEITSMSTRSWTDLVELSAGLSVLAGAERGPA